MPREVRTKSTEPVPFTFTYTLENAGWASATWETEGRTFLFTLSYMSDPLRDLLQVLHEMNEWYDDQGNLSRYADKQDGFGWQGEPWEYEFTFHPLEGRQVQLTITYQADGWDKITPAETWLETVISLDELQRQAFTHAENILRNVGLFGYRHSWINSDFPISDFLKLRSFLFNIALSAHSLAAEVEYFNSLLSQESPVSMTNERSPVDKEDAHD